MGKLGRMGRRFVVPIAALLAPAGLQGQRLASIPSYAVSELPPPTSSFRFDSTQAVPRTYWLEGGIFGGVAMGAFGMTLASGLGEGHTTTAGKVVAFLMGASVGFPVGALIGGQFPKQHETN